MIIGISGKMGSGKDLTGALLQYLLDESPEKASTKDFIDELGRLEPIQEGWIGDGFGSYKIKKFGTKLKQIVATIIGCDPDDLENRDFKESQLGKEWTVYRVKATYKGYYPEYQNILKEIYKGLYLDKDEAQEVVNLIKANYDEEKVEVYVEPCPLTPRKMLQLVGTECGRNIIHPNCWVNALFSEYVARDYRTWQDPDDSNIKYPDWIITDVRFPNEVKAIKDRGGIVIRVNRFHYDKKLRVGGEKFLMNHPDDNIRSGFISWKQSKGQYMPNNYYLMDVEAMAREAGYVPLSEQHESETALDNYEFDYVLNNNGEIEDLYESLKLMVKHEWY